MGEERPRYLWDRLKEENPVVLYGMGNGADRILDLCGAHGVAVRGVFASDGFVRGHSFRGFPVQSLGELEAKLGRMMVLLAFATHRPAVLAQIKGVAERHTLLAPDLPVAGEERFTPDFLERHRGELDQVRDLLADRQSREVLENVIRFKISGDPDYLFRCQTSKEEAWQSVLRPGPREDYVDAGAYDGDTVRELLGSAGGTLGSLLALEPDRRNYRKLCKAVEELGLPRARCVQAAAWDRREELAFRQTSGRQAALGGGTPNIWGDTVDRLLEGKGATLIKYDVEGAEERALQGSQDTIHAFRPKLIVSAYHRSGDLFRLPLLVRSLRPDYRLYLRHHPCLPAWDVNLYAV